ncbi:MAG: hypothetical protein L7U47_09550 [Alphaproteobacteria bacterium]|nr:hypothetical protein [Alphaproteobacteria bacterium]
MVRNRDMNPQDPQADDWQASAESLLALEAEIPLLSAVREFTERAARARWFAELGEPIDPKTDNLARAYLDGLGFPDAEPLPVLNWDDALDASESGDLNSAAWEAEEQLRAALTDRVLEGVSEEGLGVMLAHLSAALAEPLAEMADEALMMADEPPDAIRDLAVGAAQQAAFGGALALAAAALEMADTDDQQAGQEALEHPLMMRYRLFELGRWPLALSGRSLNLF